MEDYGIYYSPEMHGLELLGQIEWRREAYEFDLTAVWKRRRGEYFFAYDSGCSCPSPFEGIHGVADLEGPYDKKALSWHLHEMAKNRGDDNWGRGYAELRKDVADLLERIK